MLIVIVVTAATLLSAFVTAYEKQVLAEEGQQHDRSLEKGRVTSLRLNVATGYPSAWTALSGSKSIVGLSFVSGDVNAMYVTSYVVDGVNASGWSITNGTSPPSWMATEGCVPYQYVVNGTSVLNASCERVAPYQEVNVLLLLHNVTTVATPVSLEVFTGLADEFSYQFIPPVAIITAESLPVGQGTATLFSGLQSYQPTEDDNASLIDYSWTFTAAPGNNITTCAAPSTSAGGEVEVPPDSGSSPCTYGVSLAVTNTDGLSGNASLSYTYG